MVRYVLLRRASRVLLVLHRETFFISLLELETIPQQLANCDLLAY